MPAETGQQEQAPEPPRDANSRPGGPRWDAAQPPLATGPAGETAELPEVQGGDPSPWADAGWPADTVALDGAGEPGDVARPGSRAGPAGSPAPGGQADDMTAEAVQSKHVTVEPAGETAVVETAAGDHTETERSAADAEEKAGEKAGEAEENSAGGAVAPPRWHRYWPGASWLGGSRLGRHTRAAAARMSVLGMQFPRLTLLPVLLVIAWLLPAVPLLAAGSFTLAPMLVISIPLALVLTVVGLRRVPRRWPVSTQAMPGLRRTAPAWSALATVVVAAGFIAWQIVMKSQALIVTRDPGVYLQVAYWIAQHGSISVPTSAAAFGGGHPGLSFGSTGFIQQGNNLSPEFMAGLPAVLAAGFWAGGTGAALLVPPVLGGLAVLTFGGLTGRLVGPRWAPAGALVLALALPQQYTSRSAFAEPLTQILLFGGLCLLIDAMSLPAGPATPLPSHERRWALAAFTRRWRLAARPGAAAALAGLGGLALGLTAVVRIDGLSDALPVVPLIGVMLAARRREWLPLSIGVIIGAGYGLGEGYRLARPYLDSLGSWMWPFAIIAAGVTVVTLDAALVWRYAGLGRFGKRVLAVRPLRWLPELAAFLTVAVAAGFAVRPYVQTVRGGTSPAVVGYLQRVAGLPLDPHRTYAEDSLYWVIWYIGLPALLLGVFGLALLIRRVGRALLAWSDPDGSARLWVLPLLIIGWVTVTVLWRPGIVPDHPWASRRLVPVVLPGLILAAVWAAAWLNGRAAVRGAGKVLSSAVAVLCVAALLLPTTLTTFGIGVNAAGQPGPTSPRGGLALQQTGLGQVDAVSRLCASIGPGASVVIVDPRVASQFTQLIRGMCGVPVAWMHRPQPTAVQPVLTGIVSAHRRPVLLGGSAAEVAAYGAAPREILHLVTTQDAQVLTHPPSGTWPARYVIWMSLPT